MSSTKATVLAFLVAPVLPAVVLATISPSLTDGKLGPILGFVLVFYWFALMASLLIGGPVFWVLRKYNLVSVWTAVPSGALVGVLVLVLISPTSPEWEFAALYSSMGAASALAFWLLWRLGRAK
jgi:hypothetical protein